MWVLIYDLGMNKKRERPVYEALLAKIKSGELTRRQAATASTITGLSEGTFTSWLKSSGATKDPWMLAVRLNAGQNSPFAHKDPDKVKAYGDAVAAVIYEHMNPTQASRKFGVSYAYLNIKVRKERARIEAEEARIASEQPRLDRLAREELERQIVEACTPPRAAQ